MKPSTGAAVRLHRNAVRDRPESLSAFKWNVCPPSPEYPAPACAAVDLEPGMWQVTETGDKNGQLLKPVVASDCITAEDAKEPFKSLSAMKEGAQCKKFEIKESGNVVSVDLQCGDVKETSVEMSATYSFA